MASVPMKFYWCFLIIIVACKSQPEDAFKIAAASSLEYPFKEIVHAYEQEYGEECQLITTSSGKLSAQIVEGAPYDIFYAANPVYLESIVSSGRGYDIKEICMGPLVLWSVDGPIEQGLNHLMADDVNKIALPNPKVAPYGEAAMQALKNAGMYDKVSDKLVYGESVSQTNQFIMSRAVELGFTSKSVVLSEQAKAVGNWIEIDTSLYRPIKISRVLLGERKSNSSAQNFDAFVRTGLGKEILERYGFQMVD